MTRTPLQRGAECGHLSTRVGYDDELQSGGDPAEGGEHAGERLWDAFSQFVQKCFGDAHRLLQQLDVEDPGLVWLHVRCSCEAGWRSCQILCRAFGDGLWWRNGHGEISLLCTQKKSHLKLGHCDVFHIPRLCVQSHALKCWSQGTGPSLTLVRSGKRNAPHTQIVLGVNGLIVR